MAGTSGWNRGHNAVDFVRSAPAFVGRHKQLGWFASCLPNVMGGHPLVVLIPGEAGLGKTRLLSELRTEAVHRGVEVYIGRSYEALALPYLPFVKALSSVWEQIPEDMRRTLGTDADIIHQFLYQDRAVVPTTTPSLASHTEQDKLQVFLALSRIMIKLAQRSPTLIILDDLHWADQPSLDLLGHLVFTVADQATREAIPLLVIAAYRPVEPEARLAQLVARLEREEICQTLELGGLDETEIYDLVQALGLARASHQLVVTLREATQGNPLFIQEVVRHLMQQGALEERGGYVVTTSTANDLRLPEHVTGAIVSRTRGLSQACRNVLTCAAFLGESFSLQSLRTVAGVSEDELVGLLEEAMQQGLLLSEGQAFRFAHSLIQHVFYNEPSVVRRQRLHSQIVTTLERLYTGAPDEHILEIAHHLVHAGPEAEAEKVVEYARQAGDHALNYFDWSQAAYYYEAALEAAASIRHFSPHDLAELHYAAGLAYYRDQDVGPCLDHYEKAIEAYRLTDDIAGLAHALIAKTRTYYSLDSVPLGSLVDVQPLEEILETLGDAKPELRGRIALIMAEVYRTARQMDKANEMAQRALEIGKHIVDDSLRAHASYVLALLQTASMRLQEALTSWQNALTLARLANDHILQGWSLQRMPLLLILQGRLNEAEPIALEACELTRQTHDWGGYSVALSALACIALARGDFETVERHAHDAIAMVDRSRYPWGGRRALYALACARYLRGNYSGAEEVLAVLVKPGRVFQDPGAVTSAFVGAFRQLLRISTGETNGAVEQCAETLMSVGLADSYALAPFCCLVEMSNLVAVPAIAESACRELSQFVAQGTLFSAGWVYLLPRVLGIGAALNGRWDEAEVHFQRAIAVATEAGARPELGRTYLDYARMLAARGVVTDRHRASELLEQANTLFNDLDMESFAQRAGRLAETLQEDTPVVAELHETYADDFIAREREVLFHIAEERIGFLG